MIEKIRVRKNIINPWVYRPAFKETYRISIYYDNKSSQYIELLNKEYIKINHRQYKIINAPDLSKIYNIIIHAQDEGTLDEFYYNLIDEK